MKQTSLVFLLFPLWAFFPGAMLFSACGDASSSKAGGDGSSIIDGSPGSNADPGTNPSHPSQDKGDDGPEDNGPIEEEDVTSPSEDVAETETCDSPWVYLDEGKKTFMLGNEPYYPVSANYILSVRMSRDGEYFLAPTHSYCREPKYCCHDKASCGEVIRGQLAKAKAIGFNSLRILDLSIRPDIEEGELYMECGQMEPGDWLNYCSKENRLSMTPEPHPVGLQMIQEALDYAEEFGMKVILLAGHGALDEGQIPELYASYLEKLAGHFKDNPTLMAYDLANEPQYEFFDQSAPKSEVHRVGRLWYDAIRGAAPNTMVTMGMAQMGTVRFWDPAVMPLDFVSYHIYASEGFDSKDREYLKAFLSWMEREPYLSIIGETGFSVQPGLTTERQQYAFANFMLENSWACGVLGFQWWQFADVDWGGEYVYDNNFGIVTRDGQVRESQAAFQDFVPVGPRGDCPRPDYYGNAADGQRITRGRVIARNDQPIGNAFIQGHRCLTGGYVWTISDEDGYFELRSPNEIGNLQVSAAGYSLNDDTQLGCGFSGLDLVEVRLEKLRYDVSTSFPSACPQ